MIASPDNSSDPPGPQVQLGATLVNGAFVLGGPGTYVEFLPKRVIIGNRPGALLWGLTVFIWCVTLGVGWLFWPHSRIVAVLPSLVMGTPLVLALLNRQRWEITPGALKMRGSALGVSVRRNYLLHDPPLMRVASRLERDDRWPVWQVQVCTEMGDWIGVVESGNKSSVSALAQEIGSRLGVLISVPD
ncbi:MAG: hypothetical protein KY475_24055 [Planctomycetes bacterium]|nr:hypothetical protein [Planctomycetota bacterium]